MAANALLNGFKGFNLLILTLMYLVTGCAGFIASRVAHLLLEAGEQVVGIDNLNDYYDVALKKHRLRALESIEGFRYFKVDVEDRTALEKLFREFRFKAVINLAARAGVRSSIENPHIHMTTNAHGALNLLECMRQHEIRKLVLASTSSLYAGRPMPFQETDSVNTPISPYAATKKAAEVMCYTYHHLFQIDVTILRYFTVYGPAGRPDMSYFRFIKRIDQGKPIDLFGDGNQARDFTFVDDIARGTVLATHTKTGYEIVNLGGGQTPITINEMISLIEQRLGKKALVNYLPRQETDMEQTWADISKAESLLGWKPKIAFEQGIAACVDWYRENRSWLVEMKD